MRPNLQETDDLVTFVEEILMEYFIFFYSFSKNKKNEVSQYNRYFPDIIDITSNEHLGQYMCTCNDNMCVHEITKFTQVIKTIVSFWFSYVSIVKFSSCPKFENLATQPLHLILSQIIIKNRAFLMYDNVLIFETVIAAKLLYLV